MAAVAGLQHHHIGMLRLYEEKQGGDEAEHPQMRRFMCANGKNV